MLALPEHAYKVRQIRRTSNRQLVLAESLALSMVAPSRNASAIALPSCTSSSFQGFNPWECMKLLYPPEDVWMALREGFSDEGGLEFEWVGISLHGAAIVIAGKQCTTGLL